MDRHKELLNELNELVKPYLTRLSNKEILSNSELSSMSKCNHCIKLTIEMIKEDIKHKEIDWGVADEQLLYDFLNQEEEE
jgi:hypothetical protein